MLHQIELFLSVFVRRCLDVWLKVLISQIFSSINPLVFQLKRITWNEIEEMKNVQVDDSKMILKILLNFFVMINDDDESGHKLLLCVRITSEITMHPP